MQVNVNLFNGILTGIIAITSFAPYGISHTKTKAVQNLKLTELFTTTDSVGNRAICASEGNCNPDGTKTSIYYGHDDPGNGKRNRGFCSNQGRSKGSIEDADKGCLERMRSRLVSLQSSFVSEGINPDTEVFVNAADLWNQASPRVSDAFAKAYATATKKDKKGKDAVLWARVEAFRRSDGQLEAGGQNSGLFGICNNPNNSYSQKLQGLQPFSEEWRWRCVELDQSRRVNAINKVLSYVK